VATGRVSVVRESTNHVVRCRISQAGESDADPFDLLCHLAFNAPVLTRRQRAQFRHGFQWPTDQEWSTLARLKFILQNPVSRT